MNYLEIIRFPEKIDWETLLLRPIDSLVDLEKTVEKIMQDVKSGGDEALKNFTLQFDKVNVSDLNVTESEFAEADSMISDELKLAIQMAYSNIYKFHLAQVQKPEIIETMPGVECWRKSVPIEKVGLYIPGGSAPLFSTVLMLGIPAVIAGCKEIVLCTPPSKDASIHPAILYCASLLGIKKVFKVGGVQAIAAMAYGTESVPSVYKIFGPGNSYVTCAKQLANREGVAIDMPAGPSEVAVLADESAIPAFIAADLLSQAEHGADSQVILATTDAELIDFVNQEIEKQLLQLPRKETATGALKHSKAFLMKSIDDAIDLLNYYAPEHLIIACKDEESVSSKIINAGSVFLGNYSPESAGDYASGTNHALPTAGYAKVFAGVSTDSFVKKITYQRISKAGLNNIGFAIETMAEAEGLHAHKNAVSIRLNY